MKHYSHKSSDTAVMDSLQNKLTTMLTSEDASNCKHGKYFCSTDKVWKCRKKPKKTRMSENFADGKKKGKSRPGRVKKSGASCKGSVTSLRKKAKDSSGEKSKMYHWCANMKAGKKKG